MRDVGASAAFSWILRTRIPECGALYSASREEAVSNHECPSSSSFMIVVCASLIMRLSFGATLESLCPPFGRKLWEDHLEHHRIEDLDPRAMRESGDGTWALAPAQGRE
jgi:hypothetical protein